MRQTDFSREPSLKVARALSGSRFCSRIKKPGAEIKTIRQERQHAEQGDKQANLISIGNRQTILMKGYR
jgi:hypothetical protein